MANPTTNLGMTKPTVGGSTDTWGTTLNEQVVDIIDAVFAVGGTDVTMSDIKFNSVGLQETGAGTDTVKVQAPSAVTQYTLTMPGAVGASGQILRTSDASGTLAWVTDEEGDLKSVADATNGGLDVTNGTGPDVTLAVDFNDLAAAVVDVAADSIGILDATDNNTKKETIADLATAMGGTGLTGSSGTLNVDAAQTQITSVGALNAGSITSGFGAINNGSSAITTTGTVTATTLAGTLSTATQNSVTTATGLVTVGALNSGSIASGFGNINNGSSSITGGAGSFTTISGSTSLALATGATVTGIDNGALGSSATLLATQGAVKTYVDAQVGSFDTLAEVLAAGNTTGSNNIIVSASQKITTDTISETTSAAGVTIDSVLLKDNTVTATTFVGALTGNVTGNASGTSLTVTSGTQAAITTAANLVTVGTIGTGTWSADTIAVNKGGTGLTSYAAGDILYASGATTLAKLAKGSDTEVLTLASGVPTWAAPTVGDLTAIVAGAGMTGTSLSGPIPTLNVIGTADKITVSADAVTIASSYVGQTSITTLGTIATGVWNGTAITGDYIDATTSPLANTKIWIGDSSGDAQEFALSGDATMTAGGAITVADNAITLAKLEDGTSGDILYYAASGVPTRLAKGSDTEVLTLSSGLPVWSAPTVGDITGVTAGTGLSGGGTSGTVTLNVEASQTQITSVGALNAGSITSGFTSIDVGSGAITTSGTVSGGTLTGTLSTAAQTNITSVGTLTSVTTSGDIVMDATDKLRLDGSASGNTYIYENSADSAQVVTGGTATLTVNSAGIAIPATSKLWLDNGGDTYLTESAANVISIYTENMETYVLGGSGNPYVRIQAGAGGGTATTQYYEGGEFFWQHGVRGADENWYLTGNATLHSSYALMISGQDVTVGGALAKGSGSFKIDHPLPSMKDTHSLVHSFMESPRADLQYRGSVTLANGTASVDLDESVGMTDGTWELLCRDPQVFLQNETGWSALKGSVSGSTLIVTCKDSISNDTVSWMVVAERQDEHMMDTSWTDDDGRPILEPLKPEDVEDGS